MAALYRRVAGLVLASVVGAAAPAPASAQYTQLRECWHNCYQAYVVESQQPAFYDMCRNDCYALYGNGDGGAADPGAPLAVLRYN